MSYDRERGPASKSSYEYFKADHGQSEQEKRDAKHAGKQLEQQRQELRANADARPLTAEQSGARAHAQEKLQNLRSEIVEEEQAPNTTGTKTTAEEVDQEIMEATDTKDAEQLIEDASREEAAREEGGVEDQQNMG